MSDQSDQNPTTNPTPNLPDLQSTVDAALGSPAPTPTPVSQDAPTPLPPVESVAPVSVPDMPQLPSEPVVPPTTPAPTVVPPMPAEPIMSTPVVTSTPMTDDTPLAFASATPTPTITPPTTDSVPEPAPIVPITPPPADLPPVVPAGEVKPKKGMNKVVAGIAAGLFLVFGLVGGLYAFGVLKGVPPQIARVTEGECTPGLSESKNCSVDGCGGTQTRICKNTGVWGSWSGCDKNNPSCGTGPGDTNHCNSGETRNCNSTINGVSCPGKEPCVNGTWTGSCSLIDPKCGQPTKTPVSCTACGGSGGTKCTTVKNELNNECDSKYNTCDPNVANSCGGSSTTCGGKVCPTGYNICEDGFCKSATSDQCKAAGQEPCVTKYADFGLGYTCCAKGYTCDVSAGHDGGCIPKPKPSSESTPKPSSSPVSSMACTGLTASKANPGIGDTVTFTCAGTVSPATISVTYRFRYTTNGGTTWSTLANATANTATMTITTCGTYDVQCQSCATLNGTLTCDPFWVGVQ